MALSFSQVLRGKIDKQNVTITNVTLDATYPAGGEAITANDVGLSTISALIPLGSPGGATYEWVSATGKLKAYYGDYNNANDGLLIEIAVGDTAILSAVVVPVLAIGI